MSLGDWADISQPHRRHVATIATLTFVCVSSKQKRLTVQYFDLPSPVSSDCRDINAGADPAQISLALALSPDTGHIAHTDIFWGHFLGGIK